MRPEQNLLFNNHPPKWSLNDLLAITALQGLGGGFVPWTAWSLRPAALASVVNAVILEGLTSVVELGAGSSTFYLARAVQQTGGRLVSIEDDAVWAREMQHRLDQESLGGCATVVHCPLEPFACTSVDSWPDRAPSTWYSVPCVMDAVPETIGLLLVDGPSAGESETLVRLPAAVLLRSKLDSEFTVVLDDSDRSSEQQIAELWASWLAAQATIYERTNIAVVRNSDRFFPAL